MLKYFGKYRGKVMDNRDVEQCARIKVTVPSLLGDEQVWAMPCVPYAGVNVGLVLTPPIDADVWIEFEEGDLSSPIYSGGFWRKGELPVDAKNNPDAKVLKTEKVTLILNDKKNASGLDMQVVTDNAPLRITANQDGIHLMFNKEQVTIKITDSAIAIVNGSQSIKLTNGKVSINGDHLEVT